MKKFELTIPKPCHQNWETMTPEEKGRFCGACRKTVIDFSTMTDPQVAQFFKKPTGNVCGRFHPDQLNRTIEMPAKRIPWLKYFFTISLPAFLFSLKATAQKEMIGKVAMVNTKPLSDTTVLQPTSTAMKPPLKGRVMIKKPAKLNVEEVTTNATGLLKTPLSVQPPTIVVQEKQMPVLSQLVGTLGMVSIVPQANTKRNKIPTLNPVKKMDTALSSFSVYPNPVSANAVFFIQSNNMEEGMYEMHIRTSSGKTVPKKEIEISGKTKAVAVILNAMPAAPYFVQLTNKDSQKTFTEMIIVQ